MREYARYVQSLTNINEVKIKERILIRSKETWKNEISWGSKDKKEKKIRMLLASLTTLLSGTYKRTLGRFGLRTEFY